MVVWEGDGNKGMVGKKEMEGRGSLRGGGGFYSVVTMVVRVSNIKRLAEKKRHIG